MKGERVEWRGTRDEGSKLWNMDSLFGRECGAFPVAEDAAGNGSFCAGGSEVDGIGGVEFKHVVMVRNGNSDSAIGGELGCFFGV